VPFLPSSMYEKEVISIVSPPLRDPIPFLSLLAELPGNPPFPSSNVYKVYPPPYRAILTFLPLQGRVTILTPDAAAHKLPGIFLPWLFLVIYSLCVPTSLQSPSVAGEQATVLSFFDFGSLIRHLHRSPDFASPLRLEEYRRLHPFRSVVPGRHPFFFSFSLKTPFFLSLSGRVPTAPLSFQSTRTRRRKPFFRRFLTNFFVTGECRFSRSTSRAFSL